MRRNALSTLLFGLAMACPAAPAAAGSAPPVRARALGVPFQGTPGPLDAITDVAGVEVGQTTLVSGHGALVQGQGPVRTGVTIIHPLGRFGHEAVSAGFAVLNGTGEFTGLHMVAELGLFFGPVALTGTGNVSLVHQALVDWATRPGALPADEAVMRSLPLVGETLDQPLNDAFGHQMRAADVIAALEGARGGPVAEGNVGGGTGMIAYGFKGGIGTASRVIEAGGRRYTVGVLLQSNHGRRSDLRVAGVPVGEEIADLQPVVPAATGAIAQPSGPPDDRTGKNSILIVIATDAPLDARQLGRLARRAAFGLGRNGGSAGDLSGEFALAFSTGYRLPLAGPAPAVALVNDNDEPAMNALFEGVTQAVEEAEINQLVASRDMEGADGAKVFALPHDRLIAALRRHGRWRAP